MGEPFTTMLGVAGDTATNLMGRIGQKDREERQLGYQKDLMDVQFKNQGSLNRQGQALQLDTWEKTNYSAQVDQLKKAGLNPGLLYGKGGAGGVTGSQGGGSAASGTAPNVPGPMDIRNAGEIKLMNAQTKVQEATAKNIEAQTPGSKADSDRKAVEAEIAKDTAQAAKDIVEADRGIKNADSLNKQLEAIFNYYIMGGNEDIAPDSGKPVGVNVGKMMDSERWKTYQANREKGQYEAQIQGAEAELYETMRKLGAANATVQAIVSLFRMAMKK